MSNYTEGPWVIRDDEVGYISQHDDQSFGMFCPLAIVYENDNAKRIVSCVNALDGLNDDALDGGWNFKSMSKYCKDIESQRDELLEALIDCRRTLEIANFTQELAVVSAAIAKAKGEV